MGNDGQTDAEDLTYYDYNGANELTLLHDTDGWTYFAYDANGNTITEQTPSHTRYFDWDGRDMLTGVRSTEDSWTDNEIRYDGMASRAALGDSTGMTYYAWDGIRVLKTEDGAGSVRQRQVHGYAPVPSVGDIALIESAAGDPYAPIPDQVGTVWKVVDASAAVANSYEYDAFGVARSASETFSNPCRFAGKPLDADAALYHFIARQYMARSGRFLSVDATLRRLTGLTDMAYVWSRPLAAVDPTGSSGLIGGLIIVLVVAAIVGLLLLIFGKPGLDRGRKSQVERWAAYYIQIKHKPTRYGKFRYPWGSIQEGGIIRRIAGLLGPSWAPKYDPETKTFTVTTPDGTVATVRYEQWVYYTFWPCDCRINLIAVAIVTTTWPDGHVETRRAVAETWSATRKGLKRFCGRVVPGSTNWSEV